MITQTSHRSTLWQEARQQGSRRSQTEGKPKEELQHLTHQHILPTCGILLWTFPPWRLSLKGSVCNLHVGHRRALFPLQRHARGVMLKLLSEKKTKNSFDTFLCFLMFLEIPPNPFGLF